MRVGAVVVLLLGGCSAEASRQPSAAEPATIAIAKPAPPEVAPSPETPANAAGAQGEEGTCLMWYACGCNVGCSKIAEPRSELRGGMQVTVVSGVQAGEAGFVHEQTGSGGERVFSLSHQEPGAPAVCARPDPRFVGYGCEVKKHGALDARACDAGCSDL